MSDLVAPRRRLEVNQPDAHIGLWQKDPNDPTLRSEIYEGLLRHLKRRGFKITAVPEVAKRHRCISPLYRLAARGDLRAEIHVSGCCVQLDWWSERSPSENRNGPRYGFEKRKRMPYLDGLRFELEVRHLLAWVAERADIVSRPKPRGDRRVGIGRGEVSAAAFIEAEYATSWHTDKALGRPKCSDSNRKSADGDLIEQESRVWFRDWHGRMLTGIAYYSLNNRWMIVTSAHSMSWASAYEIFTRCPPDLRRKRNERQRRKRLEGELAKAIQRMDFRRAETVRRILFGAELTYGIYHVENDALYGPGFSGYTKDRLQAGRFTWDEATAEVRGHPDLLRLVLPDGKHLRASELGLAKAA